MNPTFFSAPHFAGSAQPLRPFAPLWRRTRFGWRKLPGVTARLRLPDWLGNVQLICRYPFAPGGRALSAVESHRSPHLRAPFSVRKGRCFVNIRSLSKMDAALP